MKNKVISNQYFVDIKGELRDVYWPSRSRIEGVNRVVIKSLQVGYKLNKSQIELIKTIEATQPC